MRQRVTVIALIALLTITAGTGAMAAGERELRSVKVKPQPFLGLSYPGSKTNVYHVMSEAGIGVVRTSVHWYLREPRSGKYNWGPSDQRIAALQALGIDLFLTFESNAPWGILPDRVKSANGRPKDLRQWQRFVRETVERYDGDGKADAPGLKRPVRYFQFANEWEGKPHSTGGWAGSTSELIEFMNASYDAVKAQSADAVVVLGGISSRGADGLVLYEGHANYNIQSRSSAQSRTAVMTPRDVQTKPRYRELYGRFIPVTRNAKYDMADVHLYGPAARDPIRIKAFREKIGNRGLVSAECGGPSMAYKERFVPQDHFLAVVDRNLTILSEGLEFCLWFRLGEGAGASYNNSATALFDKKRQAKPGYWAFKLLAAILDGMTRVERVGTDSQFIVYRRGKSPLFVAWQDEGSRNAYASLPKGVGGDVLRVTNAARGAYVIDRNAAARQVKLSPLPTVVGQLPANL